MELITNLLDMDLSALVPDLPVVLGFVCFLVVLAVLSGPILLTGFGALYLFRPVPEINLKHGFRTYFGMGSNQAWRYAQRIAGLAFGGLGAVLLLAMLITVFTFIGKDLFRITTTAAICLLIQAVLVLVARLTVAILCCVYFDKDGFPRR